MKNLFSSIDKLIADIPDDKDAWEKTLEILDNDDCVDAVLNKMAAGKSPYGYVKSVWKMARKIEFAVHVMSSVPVYVVVRHNKADKEELCCVTFLLEENQPDLFGDDNLGILVFIDRDSVQNVLSKSQAENSSDAFICRIPLALLVDKNIGIFDDDEAPEFLIFINGEKSTLVQRFQIAPLMCASAFALRSSLIEDIMENIFDIRQDDDEDDDEPIFPNLNVRNNLPPC